MFSSTKKQYTKCVYSGKYSIINSAEHEVYTCIFVLSILL